MSHSFEGYVRYGVTAFTNAKQNNHIQVLEAFIVCPGLGHVNRGFESFTEECFEALMNEATINLTLYKGGGNHHERQVKLPNCPRNGQLAIVLGKLLSRHPYFVEQASFFVSILPHIYAKRPQVIYFSDAALGAMLWHWRRMSGCKYKLLFSNGAPDAPSFVRWDHVQQVAPVHLNKAVAAGIPLERQSLLPYGIKMPDQLRLLSQDERTAVRSRLNLPIEKPLILSVGAINKSHKRMHHLIKEVANLSAPRPHLLLLGQRDSESNDVVALGNNLLGDGFEVRTVSALEVSEYYKVSDVFVLASLNEGLPRVLLEALSNGLPCIAHDYEIARYALRDQGYLIDMTAPGDLSALLGYVLMQNADRCMKIARHKYAYEQFSWDKLRSSYSALIHQTACN